MKTRIFLILAALIVILCFTACDRANTEHVTEYEVNTEVNSDFVIRDGVLVTYSGEDAEVVIPDSVTTISRTAFLGSTGISSLTIGSNVETIEAFSLAPIMGKARINISSDNEYYEMFDDAVVKKDGTRVIIDSIGTNPGYQADLAFWDIMNAMEIDGYLLADIENIEIGNAMVETEPSNGDFVVKSVTAFGKTVDFDDALEIVGNRKFQAFEAEDYFVISTIQLGDGKTYVITKTQCAVVETPLDDSEDWYNRSVLSLFEEDGKVFYERIPRKYYNIQVQGGVFDKCVSRNELFREVGTIEMNNGVIEYFPKSVTTVSEAVDFDYVFSLWCETMSIDPSAVTIDEYLQENGKIYGLAK